MKIKKIKSFGKTQIQRLWITMQLFFTNGLTNHASAGAFGFLFSATPVLLLTALFLSTAFRSSPQAVYTMLKQIPFIDIAFDEEWLTNEFLVFPRRGLSVILSLLTIFLAGRIFAASLLKGLKIIFTGTKKRKTVINNLLVFLIEMFALILTMVMILSSRMSLQFFQVLDYLPESFITIISNSRLRIFQIIALCIVSYATYRISSANAPSRRSALYGSLCAVFLNLLLSTVFKIIMDQAHYYFLYGALGSLIILLLNVYFFFVFFFFGAQLAYVIDNFDSLIFIQFRRIREGKKHSFLHNILKKKLLGRVDGRLEKFLHHYEKGEIIFAKGDRRKEIYYLLEGEVEVLIHAEGNAETEITSPLTSSFFGETGHLLSENRSTTARAKTAISVLELPPALFEHTLKLDPDLDRAIIEQLSQRLKQSNEKISSLTAEYE